MNVNGSDIEIEISASSESAAKSIDKLASSMKNLKDSFSGGTAKYKNVAGALKELADVAKQFESTYAAFGKVAKALERLAGMGRISISKSVGDGIRNIGEAASTVTQEGVNNLDAMTRSLQRLQNVDLSGVGSAIRDAKSGMNANATDSGSGIDLGKDAAAQVDSMTGVVDKATKKMNEYGDSVKRAREEVDKLGSSASKAKGPLMGFLSSLKRIAFYRLLRTIIKEITQAFQEGLKNAYAFSKGILTEGHRFSAAMDSMSSAGLKMKNQLGSALISLLTAVAPIINAIINLVTKLADVLSQVFSAFTGSTYLKAVDVNKEWEESANGAAKAAKEWKNQILGFDEINRLEAPSDTGGGGSGSGGVNPGDMFEDTPISEGILAFVQKIKDIIDEIDWETIKNVFKELKEDGPWLYDNLIKPFIEWDIERVVKGINGLFGVIDKLIKLLNGDMTVSEFFDEIDTDLDGLIGWLNPLDAFAKKIGEWLGPKFKELVHGIVEQWGYSKEELGKLWDRIKKFFKDNEIGWPQFANVMILGLTNPIGAIMTLIGYLTDLGKWIDYIRDLWNGAKEAIGNAVNLQGSADFNFGLRAGGGFVDEGQMFIAREAGPELVGTIGGKTAVANNDEIVAAIEGGVFRAVTAAMGNNGSGGGQVAVLNINGREFARAIYSDQKAVANEHGGSLILGI